MKRIPPIIMDRSTTANNDYDSIPPWEKGHIAQVPYLDASSPSLSNAEREALPSLWAASTNTTTTPPHPRLDTNTKTTSRTVHRSVASSDNQSNSWGVKTPLTAPPPPVPYETPVYIPPGPKSEPHPPTFVKAPPTPPDSESWSYKTDSTTGSPKSNKEIEVLPGTMSARNTEPRAHRTRTASSTRQSRKRATRMQRWRSAFKDLFTHHLVDETDFERIEDRHWTEE